MKDTGPGVLVICPGINSDGLPELDFDRACHHHKEAHRNVQDAAHFPGAIPMSVIKHRTTRSKATVICSRNGKVLLVRRKGAKWKFPSGLLARGETPMVAAARDGHAEST
jgi:hypothetical protein